MEIPNQEQFSRIFVCIERIDELAASQVPRAIAQLREDGEPEEILSYLRLNYALPSPPEYELKPGDRIADHYSIQAKIGAGGMGIVYRATQDHTQRDVALKLIHPGLNSRTLIDRFETEIVTLGKLDHPGIVHLFDADIHDGAVFFTMQLLDGMPLHHHLRQAELTLTEKLDLIIRLCDAVQAAHDRDIVHRDLKPGNIFIDRNSGRPVVLDFGLATLAGQLIGTDERTISGLSGTPNYMSPEQFLGSAGKSGTSQSVDIYALGMIAFEIIAGHSPYEFPNDSSWATKRRIVLETSPSHLEELPQLDIAIHKAIRKAPANRYATASSFADDLRRIYYDLTLPKHLAFAYWQSDKERSIQSSSRPHLPRPDLAMALATPITKSHQELILTFAENASHPKTSEDPPSTNSLINSCSLQTRARFPEAAQLTRKLNFVERGKPASTTCRQVAVKREQAAYRSGMLRAGLMSLSIGAALAWISWFAFQKYDQASSLRLAEIIEQNRSVQHEPLQLVEEQPKKAPDKAAQSNTIEQNVALSE